MHLQLFQLIPAAAHFIQLQQNHPVEKLNAQGENPFIKLIHFSRSFPVDTFPFNRLYFQSIMFPTYVIQIWCLTIFVCPIVFPYLYMSTSVKSKLNISYLVYDNLFSCNAVATTIYLISSSLFCTINGKKVIEFGILSFGYAAICVRTALSSMLS